MLSNGTLPSYFCDAQWARIELAHSYMSVGPSPSLVRTSAP
jgi:hypothetical protein